MENLFRGVRGFLVVGEVDRITTTYPSCGNPRVWNFTGKLRGQIEPTTLTMVREAVNEGLLLGNDRFRQQIY